MSLDVHPVLHTAPVPTPAGDVIYFGMGCFWGAERIFWQVPGVVNTAVGYLGGTVPDPFYELVCTGTTGHAEVVRVVYNPDTTDVDTLLAGFWENHDPTTLNRQGGDIGTQYRSLIVTTSHLQQAAAEKSLASYQRSLSESGFGTISTEITPVEQAGNGVFYLAEDYHQAYLVKNPGGYCNHGFCQVAFTPPASATAES